MQIERYRQTSTKISCSSDIEFIRKINALGAAGNMDMTIKPTTSDTTDTKQWYIVNYWINT